jgi:hypothetical protein
MTHILLRQDRFKRAVQRIGLHIPVAQGRVSIMVRSQQSNFYPKRSNLVAIPARRRPNYEGVDPTVVESPSVRHIVVPRCGRKLVGRSGHAPPDGLEVFAVLPPLLRRIARLNRVNLYRSHLPFTSVSPCFQIHRRFPLQNLHAPVRSWFRRTGCPSQDFIRASLPAPIPKLASFRQPPPEASANSA